MQFKKYSGIMEQSSSYYNLAKDFLETFTNCLVCASGQIVFLLIKRLLASKVAEAITYHTKYPHVVCKYVTMVSISRKQEIGVKLMSLSAYPIVVPIAKYKTVF